MTDVREALARLLLQSAWSDKPSINQANEWVNHKDLWIQKAGLFQDLLQISTGIDLTQWRTDWENAPYDTDLLMKVKRDKTGEVRVEKLIMREDGFSFSDHSALNDQHYTPTHFAILPSGGE